MTVTNHPLAPSLRTLEPKSRRGIPNWPIKDNPSRAIQSTQLQPDTALRSIKRAGSNPTRFKAKSYPPIANKSKTSFPFRCPFFSIISNDCRCRWALIFNSRDWVHFRQAICTNLDSILSTAPQSI